MQFPIKTSLKDLVERNGIKYEVFSKVPFTGSFVRYYENGQVSQHFSRQNNSSWGAKCVNLTSCDEGWWTKWDGHSWMYSMELYTKLFCYGNTIVWYVVKCFLLRNVFPPWEPQGVSSFSCQCQGEEPARTIRLHLFPFLHNWPISVWITCNMAVWYYGSIGDTSGSRDMRQFSVTGCLLI